MPTIEIESIRAHNQEAPSRQQSNARFQPRSFEPQNPPDLRHTRITSASFADRSADGWNRLVHVAHIEAMGRLGSVDALRRMSKSNIVLGRAASQYEKKGYRYVAGINVSIQNVDAEHAWSNTLRLAKALKIHVEVDFEWMQKLEAAYPGQMGKLSWNPS